MELRPPTRPGALSNEVYEWCKLVAKGMDPGRALVESGVMASRPVDAVNKAPSVMVADIMRSPAVSKLLSEFVSWELRLLLPVAVRRLADILESRNSDNSSLIRAATAVMDRCGLRYTQKIEHTHKTGKEDRALRIAELQRQLQAIKNPSPPVIDVNLEKLAEEAVIDCNDRSDSASTSFGVLGAVPGDK